MLSVMANDIRNQKRNMKKNSDAGSVNWKYIEGIYDNFEKRRIKTAEEAIQKEYEWQRGDLSA